MKEVSKRQNISKSIDAIHLLLALNFINKDEFNSIYEKIKDYGESR
jgi:hypothetical protein